MELHDALTDLAGTVSDDPHRLAGVHARSRRNHRTRVAVTAASTAGVVGAALVVGALAFGPSSPSPHSNLATGAVWADVTTSRGVQSALGPKLAKRTCGGFPAPAVGLPPATIHVGPGVGPGLMVPARGLPQGAIRVGGPPSEPLSPPVWTGTPPPVGVPFSLSGTVTATTKDSLTITVLDGNSQGSFVMPSACAPPLAAVGAEAHIAGTRTGPDTYDFNTVAVMIRISPTEPAQL